MLLLSGVSGTQGIGYRHAWWVCDVSHFSTGLTYLDRCIFRHGTEYEVRTAPYYFNVVSDEAGRAVDENEELISADVISTTP